VTEWEVIVLVSLEGFKRFKENKKITKKLKIEFQKNLKLSQQHF
jgi:hypothetical protein